MPDYVQLAGKVIKAHSSQLTGISNQLWDTAEIRFQEWRSAHLLCEELENEGFTVERGVGGLPTAFRASFGSGGPVIGFLGEYDALPGLSQQHHPAGGIRQLSDSGTKNRPGPGACRAH